MKNYLKLYLWVVIFLVSIGFIVGFAGPMAISAASDIAVFFGLSVVFVGIPWIVFVISKINKELKNVFS